MRHLPRIRPSIGSIVLIALSTTTSMSALAGEPSPAWNDVLAIEGQLGIGAPTGLAGLGIDVTPNPHVSLNAGAGRGYRALQLSAMARVRPFFIRPNIAPGIGAGVSGGDTGTLHILFSDSYLLFEQAIWANGEVFFEFRRGPFHLRPFVGYARRVRHSGCTYVGLYDVETAPQPCSAIDQGRLAQVDNMRGIVYTGVAIGWSFL